MYSHYFEKLPKFLTSHQTDQSKFLTKSLNTDCFWSNLTITFKTFTTWTFILVKRFLKRSLIYPILVSNNNFMLYTIKFFIWLFFIAWENKLNANLNSKTKEHWSVKSQYNEYYNFRSQNFLHVISAEKLLRFIWSLLVWRLHIRALD